MLTGLAKLFKRDRREFEAFRIEVSSCSSLESPINPRAVFAEKWRFANMPLSTFRRIADHFPQARRVVFRGWGDPLENADFPAMFELARQSGCLTGLVTPGLNLTPELSGLLIEGGLDTITFTLEEIPPEEGEGRRIGPEFRQILDQIGQFIARKRSLAREKPQVKLSFIMTRLNMGRLSRAVPAAVKLGADKLIFKNLDYLPLERWNILRAFHHESPTPAFQEALAEIVRLSRELKLPVRHSPLQAQELPVCEAEPHHSLFFAVDGSVSPCMYLCLPKAGKIRRIFLNQEYKLEPKIYGNIAEEDLGTIWAREKYRAFRKVFEDRIKAAQSAADLLEALSNPGSSPPQIVDPPPLRKACRTCYKACGI
jgi:MoaA/NifB/PqqE/SkfB family radical SAM enzyme